MGHALIGWACEWQLPSVCPELNVMEADEQGGGSHCSSSNSSLPSVANDRASGVDQTASWAVSFERLLEDPTGVRYFTVSLPPVHTSANLKTSVVLYVSLYSHTCTFSIHIDIVWQETFAHNLRKHQTSALEWFFIPQCFFLTSQMSNRQRDGCRDGNERRESLCLILGFQMTSDMVIFEMV